MVCVLSDEQFIRLCFALVYRGNVLVLLFHELRPIGLELFHSFQLLKLLLLPGHLVRAFQKILVHVSAEIHCGSWDCLPLLRSQKS